MNKNDFEKALNDICLKYSLTSKQALILIMNGLSKKVSDSLC